MNKIKFLKIVAVVFSLFFTWPFVFAILYLHNFDFGLLLFWGNNFDEFGGLVFALSTLIFALFLIITNSIIGVYLYRKTNKKKYLSLAFLAGFGSLIFFILFDLFKKRIKLSRKGKKIMVTISGAALTSSSLLTVGFAICQFTNFKTNFITDKPSGEIDDSFEVSLDENKPNVIEMFCDGLDINYFSQAMNDEKWESLSDFTYYPKFVEKGFYTADSEGSLLMGDSDYRSEFNIRAQDFSEHKYMLEAISYSGADHQQNHIGNINTGPSKTFEGSWSGNSEFFESEYQNVNTLNWTKANQLLGDKLKNDFSPEYAPYAAYLKFLKAGRPSYSKLDDTITHGPYHTSPKGGYEFIGSPLDSFKAVTNFLVDLKNKLSSIHDQKDQSFTAYDNTTIIVYGDHGSHEIESPLVGKAPNDGNKRKNQSALFVKPLKRFIKVSRPKNIDFSREIPSIYLRRILRTILVGDGNGNKVSPLDFIGTNKNFDQGRIFSSNYLGHTFFSKYDANNILQPYDAPELVNGWTKNGSEIYKKLIEEEIWKK